MNNESQVFLHVLSNTEREELYMKKQNWEIDVAVLLIFFCRDKQFKEVFEQVKKARPRVLFLYQDGARENRPDDIDGIERCREIADDINWECEVHKYYQEKNVGCDPSEFIAQKWAFGIVDKCIILEDDDVPSQSFFRFCKELLDKYENDERINMICGMNNNDVTEDINESYLFTTKGSIWGWASWKRVIDTWDGTYSILEDVNALRRMKENFDSDKEFDGFIKTCKKHRGTGREHYESINALATFSNNRLNIVPKYNMISNIGIGEETTHGSNDIRKYPKRIRSLFYKKAYEIDFPLVHPKYVMRNRDFETKMTFTKKDRILNIAGSAFLTLKYGGIKEVAQKIRRKVGKE